MRFEEIEALCNTVEALDSEAQYQDGLATVPAYLLERLHNIVFPSNQRHDFTDARS